MNRPSHVRGWQNFIVVCGSLFLVVAGLYWARDILIPIALAIFIAFILNPLVMLLRRRGVGRVLAVLSVASLAFSVLGGFILLVYIQLRALGDELPQHHERVMEKITSMKEAGQGSWLSNVNGLVQDVAEHVRHEWASTTAKQPGEPVPVVVETGGLPEFVQSLISSTAAMLLTAGLVAVLAIFILIQRENLRNRLIRLRGGTDLASTTRAIDEATQRISRFLVMQLVINIVFGVAFGLGLLVIGVPYVLLWGFLVAVFRYIPYVGVWIGVFFPVVLSLAIHPSWIQPLSIIGYVLFLELISANVAEPLLFGKSTGVADVALLVSAAFWAWLWGPIGLVLATPLTACLAVLGRYIPTLKFLHIMLGDEETLEFHVRYFQRLLARDEHEASTMLREYSQTHSPEEMAESVFLPALLLFKQNRSDEDLDSDDERFFLQTTREFIDEFLPGADRTTPADPDSGIIDFTDRPHVFGCPAHDEFDGLALELFGRLLPPGVAAFEVCSHELLLAEQIAQVRRVEGAIVLIGALPPGGMVRCRYMCKRFRSELKNAKILVGYWGAGFKSEQIREQFVSACADNVSQSLIGSREQLIPMVQFAAASPAA